MNDEESAEEELEELEELEGEEGDLCDKQELPIWR